MRTLQVLGVAVVLSATGCAVEAASPEASKPEGEGKSDYRGTETIQLTAATPTKAFPLACNEYFTCNVTFRARATETDKVALELNMPADARDMYGRNVQGTVRLETTDRWCRQLANVPGWILDPREELPKTGADCDMFEHRYGSSDEEAVFNLNFSLMPTDPDGKATIELEFEVS